MSKKSNFDVTPYTKKGYSKETVLEVKTSFDIFDTDRSGFIDVKQLKAAMVSLGFSTTNRASYVMILDLDRDGSGTLQFNEFFELMMIKFSDRYSQENCKKLFAMYDIDQKGVITTQDLILAASTLGETVSREEIDEMMRRADLNNDGMVDREEFYKLMSKTI